MKPGDLVRNIHAPKRYGVGIIINKYGHHTPAAGCTWFYILWKGGLINNCSIEVLSLVSKI